MGRRVPPHARGLPHAVVRGLPIDPERLFTTNGNSQALEMLCTVLTKPGDIVIVKEPTYFLAFQMFRDHGLEIRGVPIDSDGLVVEALLAEVAAVRRVGPARRVRVHDPGVPEPDRSHDVKARRRAKSLVTPVGFWNAGIMYTNATRRPDWRTAATSARSASTTSPSWSIGTPGSPSRGRETSGTRGSRSAPRRSRPHRVWSRPCTASRGLRVAVVENSRSGSTHSVRVVRNSPSGGGSVARLGAVCRNSGKSLNCISAARRT